MDKLQIEIDEGSGFCFGVTTAIKKAEEELKEEAPLYCLGDIVHNGMECERLKQLGLITINHDDLKELYHAKVLLRAHGEPPSTYELAQQNDIEIIDATCPVVLQLQKRIKQQYALTSNPSPLTSQHSHLPSQIVIFGKRGHAEVMGLVGQTDGQAVVIENFDEIKRLDFSRDIYLYSQTTKSLDEFHRIIDFIQTHIEEGVTFKSFDFICRQVANRMPHISQFAARHDLFSLSAAIRAATARYCSTSACASTPTRISSKALMRYHPNGSTAFRPSVSVVPHRHRNGSWNNAVMPL